MLPTMHNASKVEPTLRAYNTDYTEIIQMFSLNKQDHDLQIISSNIFPIPLEIFYYN